MLRNFVTSFKTKLYNISFDKCYSNTINCGIRSLSCSKEEYNVSNQNKKIFCPAPYKIKSTDVETWKAEKVLKTNHYFETRWKEIRNEYLRMMEQYDYNNENYNNCV